MLLLRERRFLVVFFYSLQLLTEVTLQQHQLQRSLPGAAVVIPNQVSQCEEMTFSSFRAAAKLHTRGQMHNVSQFRWTLESLKKVWGRSGILQLCVLFSTLVKITLSLAATRDWILPKWKHTIRCVTHFKCWGRASFQRLVYTAAALWQTASRVLICIEHAQRLKGTQSSLKDCFNHWHQH